MSQEEEQNSMDQKDDQSENSDFVEVASEDIIQESAPNLVKDVSAQKNLVESPLSRPSPSAEGSVPKQPPNDPLTGGYYGQLLDTYGDEEAVTGGPVQVIEHPLQNIESYIAEDEINVIYDSRNYYGDTTPAAPELDAQPVDPDEKGHVLGFKNAKETVDLVELAVAGKLPPWLNGELFTVGPGTYDINYGRKIMVDDQLEMATFTFKFEHWFDALPLVNRIDIDGSANQILYRSKLPTRRLVSKIRDHHGYQPTHAAGLFKTNTNQSFLAKFLKPTGKSSKPDLEPCGACVRTHIPGMEGRLFAQNNATEVVELDPNDLTPTHHFSWNEVNPSFRGHQASPHAQYDPATGEWINFVMEAGVQGASYNFFSITEANPRGVLITSVQAKTSFVHSFALTPRYIILTVFPYHANYGGMQFTWHESILDSFSFKEEPTLFYVISRLRKRHIATYKANPFFAFHHINAFEDITDNIHVDIACYSSPAIAHQLTTDNLRHPDKMEPTHLTTAEVRRYTLNKILQEAANFETHGRETSGLIGGFTNMLSSAASTFSTAPTDDYSWMPMAKYEKIVNATLELPQINPTWKLNRHQYLFGIGMSSQGVLEPGRIWDAIVKADLDKKTIVHSWSQEGCFPSEALFIPVPAQMDPNTQLPGRLDEDDGVLASIVLDSIQNKSFLLVLDARNFKEIAKADLPQVVPLSFAHGCFRPKT